MKIYNETETIVKTYYECEGCGERNTWDAYVGKCPVCGAEVCRSCSTGEFDLVDEECITFVTHEDNYRTYGMWNNDNYTTYHLCSKCSTSVATKLQNSYDKKVAKLIEKFNNNLAKLNNEYRAKLKELK